MLKLSVTLKNFLTYTVGLKFEDVEILPLSFLSDEPLNPRARPNWISSFKNVPASGAKAQLEDVFLNPLVALAVLDAKPTTPPTYQFPFCAIATKEDTTRVRINSAVFIVIRFGL